MARTAGRSSADTRRLILDTAARVVGRSGTAVPVSEIAAAAGISKGGLLYHFPTKESLLYALGEDLMSQFREQVRLRAEEEGEPARGRLTRAYIRVSFADAADFTRQRDAISLAAHLMFEPELEKLAQQDAQQWREELLEDGLDPAVVRLVIAAADGSGSAPLWGAILDGADRDLLEEQLIALTVAPDTAEAPGPP
ncbi:TetR/AcrR family transcriptional regulator [Brachybacterium sp. AOP43-C2-M15]|uniref:TetR/AcrR family transcriptional regulator n=1 Tax=Brachybacterium sp. AOP43-C2-M15 TaxID=3457661 RepID=UPI0040344707